MLEREKIIFFDTSNLTKTEEIEARANCAWLRSALSDRDDLGEIVIDEVSVITDGIYHTKKGFLGKILGKKLTDLPPFCEVKLRHKTGDFYEKIILWTPLAWNDRFATTAGGGTGIGGASYITIPDNTTRGWTMGLALMNGFSVVTADAANVDGIHDYMLDPDTHKLRYDLYENWRVRTTHNMTIIGKAVTELLHQRPVKYSYINGGSGGGRQTMMAVQNYPEDFDGAWASCPAIYWPKFLLGGLWMTAMMQERGDVLAPEKLKFFTEKAREIAGGDEAFYKRKAIVEFQPYDYVGQETKKGVITEKDAQIMTDILGGAKDRDGKLLFPLFRPGVQFWQVGIPIGAMYYSLIKKKPKLFVVSTNYLRWVTGNPKQKFEDIDLNGFYELYEASTTKFADAMGDNTDLSAFYHRGGKLMIDHGINDPLIPVDGTIGYFQKLRETMGQETCEDFVRLYLTPGDGHGNCWDKGPGLTMCSGMKALMDWVEKGQAPEELRAVRVAKGTGAFIEETKISPVKDISEYQ